MLAASLVALPCGAYPGELRLSPYVETGISRDSNLFASSEDSREADTQRRATVGADARWGMSRQQLSLHVDLAQRHERHILAGSLPVATDAGLVNRAWLIAPTGAVAAQQPVMKEQAHFAGRCRMSR